MSLKESEAFGRARLCKKSLGESEGASVDSTLIPNRYAHVIEMPLLVAVGHFTTLFMHHLFLKVEEQIGTKCGSSTTPDSVFSVCCASSGNKRSFVSLLTTLDIKHVRPIKK